MLEGLAVDSQSMYEGGDVRVRKEEAVSVSTAHPLCDSGSWPIRTRSLVIAPRTRTPQVTLSLSHRQLFLACLDA